MVRFPISCKVLLGTVGGALKLRKMQTHPLCYMDSGTCGGCGCLSNCRIYPILMSKVLGHNKIFIFLNMFSDRQTIHTKKVISIDKSYAYSFLKQFQLFW